jgi:long-chain acyl-CoA synthetase
MLRHNPLICGITSMYIGTRAMQTPDKAAIIMAGTGEVITYRQLDERSNQVAHFLRAAGLRRGDRIAIFMENHPRFMEIAWAAFRSGLYVATINKFFTAADVAYVVKDCDAKVLFASPARSEAAADVPKRFPAGTRCLMVDEAIQGWESYEAEVGGFPTTPIADEWMGLTLDYTSGTTGTPKGVLRALPPLHASETWPAWEQTGARYGFDHEMVALCPAPLYHGAPMRAVRPAHMAGGTVVIMDKFDAEEALRLIEKYRVTHGQFVPTMFGRMLKLPADVRSKYDLSSLRYAVHAAAPCPQEVKRQMIEWWGPIVHEYYGATDGAGGTSIDCEEWLAHPGSVGKAPPNLHVCDEDGDELPRGESGLLYFEAMPPLPSYINDPEKTRSARHPTHENWGCVGDIGRVDEDGYLYLTDRKAFTIVSGGVNIYPQIIEDALLANEIVADAAVFGIPNDDMGEEVKAIVQLVPGVPQGPSTAAGLQGYLASRIAKYMMPKSIDFTDSLPRNETGKLLKKTLRDEYWKGRTLTS